MVRLSKQHQHVNAAPLTTLGQVEAHIEAAKLFFALSKEDGSFGGLSSTTLVQLALNVLLMTLPILPQVDFKIGNPRLPVDIDDYVLSDLDTIDFQAVIGDSAQVSIMELGQRIEQNKQTDTPLQSFLKSDLMKIKILNNQYMV